MKMVDVLRKNNHSKSKENKAITLIALVITIIVLLILAGVTVATITGENGLLSKAQLAKERTIEAEQDEKDKLNSYEDEINNYGTWERTGESGSEKRNYNVTTLYTGSAGKDAVITFADNHTLSEFDSIKLLYGEKSGDKWCAFNTIEYTIEELNYIINNHKDCTYWIALNGFGEIFIDIYDISQTGFKIGNNNSRTIAAVFGINY